MLSSSIFNTTWPSLAEVQAAVFRTQIIVTASYLSEKHCSDMLAGFRTIERSVQTKEPKAFELAITWSRIYLTIQSNLGGKDKKSCAAFESTVPPALKCIIACLQHESVENHDYHYQLLDIVEKFFNNLRTEVFDNLAKFEMGVITGLWAAIDFVGDFNTQMLALRLWSSLLKSMDSNRQQEELHRIQSTGTNAMKDKLSAAIAVANYHVGKFEKAARDLLNCHNMTKKQSVRVYSFRCNRFKLNGEYEFVKPLIAENFWIDLNSCPTTLTFRGRYKHMNKSGYKDCSVLLNVRSMTLRNIEFTVTFHAPAIISPNLSGISAVDSITSAELILPKDEAERLRDNPSLLEYYNILLETNSDSTANVDVPERIICKGSLTTNHQVNVIKDSSVLSGKNQAEDTAPTTATEPTPFINNGSMCKDHPKKRSHVSWEKGPSNSNISPKNKRKCNAPKPRYKCKPRAVNNKPLKRKKVVKPRTHLTSGSGESSRSNIKIAKSVIDVSSSGSSDESSIIFYDGETEAVAENSAHSASTTTTNNVYQNTETTDILSEQPNNLLNSLRQSMDGSKDFLNNYSEEFIAQELLAAKTMTPKRERQTLRGKNIKENVPVALQTVGTVAELTTQRGAAKHNDRTVFSAEMDIDLINIATDMSLPDFQNVASSSQNELENSQTSAENSSQTITISSSNSQSEVHINLLGTTHQNFIPNMESRQSQLSLMDKCHTSVAAPWNNTSDTAAEIELCRQDRPAAEKISDFHEFRMPQMPNTLKHNHTSQHSNIDSRIRQIASTETSRSNNSNPIRGDTNSVRSECGPNTSSDPFDEPRFPLPITSTQRTSSYSPTNIETTANAVASFETPWDDLSFLDAEIGNTNTAKENLNASFRPPSCNELSIGPSVLRREYSNTLMLYKHTVRTLLMNERDCHKKRIYASIQKTTEIGQGILKEVGRDKEEISELCSLVESILWKLDRQFDTSQGNFKQFECVLQSINHIAREYYESVARFEAENEEILQNFRHFCEGRKIKQWRNFIKETAEALLKNISSLSEI